MVYMVTLFFFRFVVSGNFGDAPGYADLELFYREFTSGRFSSARKMFSHTFGEFYFLHIFIKTFL